MLLWRTRTVCGASITLKRQKVEGVVLWEETAVNGAVSVSECLNEVLRQTWGKGTGWGKNLTEVDGRF